ncbi:MAG: hypothetical protein QGI45_11605, partial [Myxococcota bacterium]|nr:hypothetical protein [Myxococcota bacterium]
TADTLEAPLSGGKAQAHSAANLVVTWEAANGQNLKDYGEKRLTKLKTSLPGFNLSEQGIWSPEGQKIFYGEYHIDMNPPLTQLLQIKSVQDDFVCLTGTAIQNSYAEVKDAFKKSMLALKSKD